jgi:hypothetical protein
MPPRDPDADPFRNFVVRLGGERDHGGGSGGGVGTVHAHNHFYVPESWSLADFQIGRGFGPYREVADNREGEGSLAVQVIAKGETRESRMVNGQSIESRHSGSDIKATLPDAFKDKDWRLLAFDTSGNPLNLYVFWDPKLGLAGHLTIQAQCNAAPETIERLVLEVRNYQWVTIKNLHLHPNSSAIHP